jgi:hypothetical protein
LRFLFSYSTTKTVVVRYGSGTITEQNPYRTVHVIPLRIRSPSLKPGATTAAAEFVWF